MVAQEKLTSLREFWDFVQRSENDKRFELIDGIIVEVAPSRKQNALVAAQLIILIGIYLRDNDIGLITTPDGGFQLGANTVRLPDVGFILHERAGEPTGNVFAAAPDLAIEVLSPSEGERKILKKARTYLTAGTKVVWTFDPDDKAAEEYRLGADGRITVQTYEQDATLTAEDVLPGFTLSLREVFKVLGKHNPSQP
jgi:Uma2 family endonuclease